MAEAKTNLQAPGQMKVTTKMKTIYSVLMFLGVAAFVVTLMTDQERAWHSYLTGFFYFLSLALGGLFFAAINHMTSAGWSVNVRRLSESLAAFLPVAFIGAIVLLIGGGQLYSWFHPEVVEADPILAGKASYLNPVFFWIRTILFFGIWLFFGKLLVGNSLKQDETGSELLTKKNAKISIAFVLLFALSYSFFSVDTLMALEPHWFSTIFGVYTFAGLFQSTMAVLCLLSIYFMRNGQLKGYVDENHLHDLGKYLFAFTVFWAYIAFSQYMLIWYANMPEETIFFIPRSHGGWLYVSMALILFKFIVPFLALLPRWAKRRPVHLATVSVLILVMQYVDLYWLVYPNFNHDTPVFALPEILVFLGFAGAFMFTMTRFLGRHSIVPVKDPRIHESVHHHVTY